MSSDSRQERVCRNCDALPKVRVSHAESHRLPRSWRPIEEHPSLRPGPWVPRGDMKGVVFCESCGTLWLLFLDPAQDYYTDVIELSSELCEIVSKDASLEQILPLAVSSDSLLQLMIRDWFALADYDPSAAAEALVGELAREDLSTRLAIRLLDFLAAVLAGAGRERSVALSDASPLVELLAREDIVSLDAVRRAREIHEIKRLLAGIARAAFGSAFGLGTGLDGAGPGRAGRPVAGADRDRLQTTPESRAALIALVSGGEVPSTAKLLAPPGPAPTTPAAPGRFDGIDTLVSEIEELLRAGASRVTSQEIAPVIDVVREFWAQERSFAPRWDPGLGLYRRCRDLLLALRYADLVPHESERAVEDALEAS